MSTTHARRTWVVAAGLVALGLAPGCTWDQLNPFQASARPKTPAAGQSAVLRVSGVEESPRTAVDANPELAEAMELFREKQYGKAEDAFHRIAEKNKEDAGVAEKARFYEAECLYLQDKLPRAADTYVRLLNDFGAGTYRDQALAKCFDIANFWLEDTREQMREVRERREGQRWFITPNFVHWDKTKPLLDQEGRALELLDHVRYNDIGGPLADKALFLCGSVKYYNEDYRDADFLFSQLVEYHPNSAFAAQATELAIISKHMCTGGSDYDGRKVAEARDLVHKAQMTYPTLAQDPDKREFLQRQLAGITMQQADKDYSTAEFYRRRNQPCPAYFMYEVVRRRYPGTKYADLATERMHQLKARVEAENGGRLPVPEASALPPGVLPIGQ